MNKIDSSAISLKAITNKDLPFLYGVYRSTRLDELKPANFSKKALEDFLQMQFNLQHTQYMKNYENPSFDLIIINDSTPVGRLYVNRVEAEIRIIDIALLTEYRRKGIGGKLMRNLINESEEKKISLSLHVEHNNPVLDFYKEIGFRGIEDRGVYLFMKRRPQSSK